MPEKKEYEISRQGREEVMIVDANKWQFIPSIEDNPIVTQRAVDYLAQAPSVSRIVFNQRKNYSYDREQTQILIEIANLFNFLTRQKKILSLEAIGFDKATKEFGVKYANMQYLVYNLLRSDPLGAYVEAKRFLREEKFKLEKITDINLIEKERSYINLIGYFISLLERTSLINKTKADLPGYVIGDRSLYQQIFRPDVSPDFIFTRIMAKVPSGVELIDSYSIKDIEVKVFKVPGDVRYLYHVTPPEFKITEDKYQLLSLARTVLAEHKPREEEFLEPARMRRTFYNIGRDLLQELSESRRIRVSFDEIKELAKILVRYTVGFGMIEVLLQDEKIQDIVANSPIGQTPLFVVHQDYDECTTNIMPGYEDAESWASKFRMLSGRPLDEANPVLDTGLLIPGARSRVAIITSPLTPRGYAYALRRHRDTPWTYPLYIENRMIDPLSAGLLSFLIHGARTILVAGTRSSGKTSLLGASLLEIMRRYRIITLEDTLELPVSYLREIGYNIQPMKVRSALMTGGVEIPADEGIRTSLRMGDSCLIVGEIRSKESLALFEAMRVGALANVVAGTIHGANPYGVFDRVVNDLGVPRTSFKATDIIVVANPIKSPDGLHKWKRVVQISEVRKHWEEDPLREGGFVDLMRYDTKKDQLVPTDDLINGESETLKSIAGNVKEWAGNWDAVWENIILRAKVKETLVNYAKKSKLRELLEGRFVVQSNDIFHMISGSVRKEVGYLESKRIFSKWESWLKDSIKKKRIA